MTRNQAGAGDPQIAAPGQPADGPALLSVSHSAPADALVVTPIDTRQSTDREISTSVFDAAPSGFDDIAVAADGDFTVEWGPEPSPPAPDDPIPDGDYGGDVVFDAAPVAAGPDSSAVWDVLLGLDPDPSPGGLHGGRGGGRGGLQAPDTGDDGYVDPAVPAPHGPRRGLPVLPVGALAIVAIVAILGLGAAAGGSTPSASPGNVAVLATGAPLASLLLAPASSTPAPVVAASASPAAASQMTSTPAPAITVPPTPAPTPDTAGPRITKFAWRPQLVGVPLMASCSANTQPSTTGATVDVAVSDPSGTGAVILLFQRAGDASPTSIPMRHIGGSTWRVALDAASDAGWLPPNQESYAIQLGIRATDKRGNVSVTALRRAFTVAVCK